MSKRKDVNKVIDPIDEFVEAARSLPALAVMLMMWLERHENPDFSIEIHPQDLQGFDACVKYLEVIPEIRIFRPEGLPAREAVPAKGERRAIPARPAMPPKNYAVIQMVDQDGNAFVPVENNERDLQRGKDSAAARKLREAASQLAAQMQADLQANVISNVSIQQAIDTIKALSR